MNQSNKTYFKVGIFVLVSFFTLILFLIIFTAGNIFQRSVSLETYFDESVQGLDIGSPVKHRGVKVGTVQEITFVQNVYSDKLNQDTELRYGRYVLIKMSVPDFVKGVYGDDLKKTVQRMIQSGLRVRLASQGLTGTAYLEVDYLNPEKNPPLSIEWEPKTIYIPSAPSTISRFTASVDKFFDKVEKADVDKILLGVGELIKNLNQTILDAKLGDLARESTGLLVDLRKTNAEVKALIASPETQGFPKKLDTSMTQLQTTLKRLDTLLASNQGDISTSIENLRIASEDLKEVTANAKKYPSQFLFGEAPNKSKLWK
ncbi:MlaD family protein [Leptospira bandrabouensis]|uniref:MlaD family protein n=1 Tax=Leptospira bandrabouensis TaxID=2484903 RepID=UPI00223E3A26|nr:MlaD family protein [Leptospira bandrabouensis]MCW7458296.1 MlaD family protein [Leptospira bandrabouensis]MCW7476958.1 MlaD family protein [Leptospira bandrabouensis]MCW7484640.1 MlaD family protein [Leptospira bandrabouensis]